MKPAALAFGLVTLVTLVFPVTVAAQQLRPDFSGTWQMDMNLSESATDGTQVIAQTLVVTQAANGLSLEVHRGEQREVLLFSLDRSSTELANDVRTQAVWNGASLVMDTVRRLSGWAVTIRETWRLDDDKTLRIERVLNVEHGYAGGSASDSSNYAKAVDIYKKSQ